MTLENSANDEVLASIDLANTISDAESTYNCTARKVELKLKKVDESITWKGLEMGSGSTPTMMASNTSGPSYPSSAKVKKDWDAVDNEMEKDMAKDKDDGDSALNGLFKQIYERSDEATRRAMIKSYQTSGGTVLSTNWGEVADKDYEGADRPSAPDGQQWADEKQ